MNFNTEDILQIISRQDYQSIPPFVISALKKRLGVDILVNNSKTLDIQRYKFMKATFSNEGGSILDIGANSGYFSMSYCSDENCIVDAYEGDDIYVQYLSLISHFLQIDNAMKVYGETYKFQNISPKKYDLSLCLNVLHHVGRYFDNEVKSIEQAKQKISKYLINLAESSKYLFFQMGFNWRGDEFSPLFANGSKREMIEFVQQVSDSSWTLERVGIFDSNLNDYVDPSKENLVRNDLIGEFANRPLFFLKSKR